MTGEAFTRWRLLMNPGKDKPLSERETADLLGCSRVAVRNWSSSGAPLYIALACAALARGLKPWPE